MSSCIEQIFSIRGLRIACKIWNAEASQKILALHGWLDNAASFDRLAAQLPYCIVAPDLAGQGLSDFRPASSHYHLWDDVLDSLLLTEQLGWQRFSLIGHSRGAMLCCMLAASFPEKVEKIVLLDALMPWPVEADACVTQLRAHLTFHLQGKSHHYFATRLEALKLRAKASHFELALAEKLAERQLRHNHQGWYWHIDERLKAPSAIKLSEQHNTAFIQAIECPAMLIAAMQGVIKSEQLQQLQQAFPKLCCYNIQGHHHLHMTDKAEELALLCQRFFS